jgi:hypothetical protein
LPQPWGVEVGSTGPNFAAAYTADATRHFSLGEIEARLNLHTTPGQRLRRDQVDLIAAINGHLGYAPSATAS